MSPAEILRSKVQFLKKAAVPIVMSTVITVAACGGEKTNPATLAPKDRIAPTAGLLSSNDKLLISEKLKKVIPIDFNNENEKGRVEIVIFETERSFEFDIEAFGKNINMIVSRGGKLPMYSRIFFSDKTIDPADPNKFGATNSLQKVIRLSIKDGLNFSFLDKYPSEAIINGVLVGEMTNLMIDEGKALPSGAGHTERLGDSAGFMAAAIFSGRSYLQYQDDAAGAEYLGQGGLIVFNQNTYKNFQENLQPALIFGK